MSDIQNPALMQAPVSIERICTNGRAVYGFVQQAFGESFDTVETSLSLLVVAAGMMQLQGFERDNFLALAAGMFDRTRGYNIGVVGPKANGDPP